MYGIYSAYFLLASFFLLTNKKLALKLFIIGACVVPSSLAFENNVSVYGIFFFENFYWLAFPIAMVSILRNGLPKKLTLPMLTILICMIYLFYSWLVFSDDLKYLIRDVRLILALASGVLLIALFKDIKLSDNEIVSIAAISAMSTIFIYIVIFSGFIKFNNIFYDIENRYRYFGVGSYVCGAFVIYFSLQSRILHQESRYLLITYILCIFVILISGYRVFVFGVFAGILLSQINTPLRFMKYFAFAAMIGALLVGASYALEIDRITSALSIEGLVKQLSARFFPAISIIKDFEFHEYLFGLGLGSTFYIPWFEYQGLDTKHNMVDSSYLTLYVKFGLFSIVYIAAFMKLFTLTRDRKSNIAAVTFCLIMMITFPIPYHSSIIMFILFYYLANNSTDSAYT